MRQARPKKRSGLPPPYSPTFVSVNVRYWNALGITAALHGHCRQGRRRCGGRHLLVLTDATGEILWRVGSRETLPRVDRLEFSEGADWSEAGIQ